MKKQIYIPIRKQLTFILVIMSFMAGSYSQKSAAVGKEDSNMGYLKGLAAVISSLDNIQTVSMNKPIAYEDIRLYNSNLKVEEYRFVPEYSDNAEEKLQVEDWMLNEEHFMTNNSNNIYVTDEEEELAIEDWMLDEVHFRIPDSNNELYEVAEEERPVVEDWMLDESHFLSRYNEVIEEEDTVEDEIKIESWMTDLNHWVLRAD